MIAMVKKLSLLVPRFRNISILYLRSCLRATIRRLTVILLRWKRLLPLRAQHTASPKKAEDTLKEAGHKVSAPTAGVKYDVKKETIAVGRGPGPTKASFSVPNASAEKPKSTEHEFLDAKLKLQKEFGVPIPSDGVSPFSKKLRGYDSSVYRKT